MAGDVLTFGDGLELDRVAYELRRSGRSLKLERIPMEILLLLVERRGQLVSRADIIEKVWGKNIHVDTDNSINAAIRKIRQVLKDDPNGRFSCRPSRVRGTGSSRRSAQLWMGLANPIPKIHRHGTELLAPVGTVKGNSLSRQRAAA
jgi:DNA-binding response OmpR family regulator